MCAHAWSMYAGLWTEGPGAAPVGWVALRIPAGKNWSPHPLPLVPGGEILGHHVCEVLALRIALIARQTDPASAIGHAGWGQHSRDTPGLLWATSYSAPSASLKPRAFVGKHASLVTLSRCP